MTEPMTPAEALAEALHRMGEMTGCESAATVEDDRASHEVEARDLLENLAAHGWTLCRQQDCQHSTDGQ